MPTIGQILKAAREQKNVTCSQAAAATRLKVQHVEAMERDDYSRVAAPIYAKGFIRLYAEYLGLDPEPLIREYADLHAPKDRPPLMQEDEAPPAPRKPRQNPLKAINWAGLWESVLKWRRVAIAAVLVILLAFGVLGIARCTMRKAEERAKAPPEPVVVKVEPGEPLARIVEPPEPYMESSSTANVLP